MMSAPTRDELVALRTELLAAGVDVDYLHDQAHRTWKGLKGDVVVVGDQRKSRFRISESRGPGVGVFLGWRLAAAPLGGVGRGGGEGLVLA